MSSSSRNKAIVRYNTEESGTGSSRESSDTASNGVSHKRRRNQESDRSDDITEEIDKIVCDCVKYLLITDHKKLPVKRVDLLKAVAKQTPNRKTTEEIIDKVRSSLSDTYAIDLVDCPDVSNCYILVNKLPADGLKEAIDSHYIPDNQLFQTCLLTSVLAVIFMTGDTVPEDTVWRFLTTLGFDVNSKTKTYQFENESNSFTIRKLLTEVWVRQLYLKYQKIPRSDPMAHEFKWGFRAEKEFSKTDILKFVCDILEDGSKPETWRTQFRIAQKETQLNRPSDEENQSDIEIIV